MTSQPAKIFIAYALPFFLKMAFDFLYLERTFFDPMAGESISHVFNCAAMWVYDWPPLLHGNFGISHYPSIFHCQLSGVFIKIFGISETMFSYLAGFILLLDAGLILICSYWVAYLSGRLKLSPGFVFAIAALAAVSPGATWYFQVYYMLAVVLPPIGLGLYMISTAEDADRPVIISTFVGLGVLAANHYMVLIIIAALFAALAIDFVVSGRGKLFSALAGKRYPRWYAIAALISGFLLTNGLILVALNAWKHITTFGKIYVNVNLGEIEYLVYLSIVIIAVSSIYALNEIVSKIEYNKYFVYFISVVGNISVGVAVSLNIVILDGWQAGVYRWLLAPIPPAETMSFFQFAVFVFDDPWRSVIVPLMLVGGVVAVIGSRADGGRVSRGFFSGLILALVMITIYLFKPLISTTYESYDIIARVYIIEGRHFSVLIVVIPMAALWWYAVKPMYGRIAAVAIFALALTAYAVDINGTKKFIAWSNEFQAKTQILFSAFLKKYPDGKIVCGYGVFQPRQCYVAQAYDRFLLQHMSNLKNARLGIPQSMAEYKFETANRRLKNQRANDVQDIRPLLFVDLETSRVRPEFRDSKKIYADGIVAIRELNPDRKNN